MSTRSVTFVQRGTSPRAQTTICLRYARSAHLPIASIVPHWAAGVAAAMIREGEASTILAAFDGPEVRRLAEDLDGMGEVVVVEPTPTTLHVHRPPGRPVIVYIHPDDTWPKQERAVLGYCRDHDLLVTARVDTPAAAAQAVQAGAAELVLAATDPRNGLRHLVTVAGGRAAFVRERSRTPSLREFLGRAVGRGSSPHDIAAAVGSPTADITELLAQLGLRDRPLN